VFTGGARVKDFIDDSTVTFFLKALMSHHPTSEHKCTTQLDSLIPNRNNQASISLIERLKPPYN